MRYVASLALVLTVIGAVVLIYYMFRSRQPEPFVDRRPELRKLIALAAAMGATALV
jgi:hypothetical protein